MDHQPTIDVGWQPWFDEDHAAAELETTPDEPVTDDFAATAARAGRIAVAAILAIAVIVLLVQL